MSVTGDLLRSFRRQPAVPIVGGLVAALFGVQLVRGRSPAPVGDPAADTSSDTSTGDSSTGTPDTTIPYYQPGIDPGGYYDPSQGGYYDPGQYPPLPPLPTPTPGCGAEPDVPPGANGDWVCTPQADGTSRWTWSPTPAATGCTTPRPPTPDGMKGKGHYHCRNGTWVWKPKVGPAPNPCDPSLKPPDPPGQKGHYTCSKGVWTWHKHHGGGGDPTPGAKCTIATLELRAGRHVLMHIRADGRVLQTTPVTTAGTQKSCASVKGYAIVQGPKGKTSTRITVAQFKSGPHSGKWINVAEAGVTWARV